MNSTFKAPGAKRRYTLDWTDDLAGDTIASSTWTVPEGMTKVSETNTTTTATVTVSGGISGQTYSLINHVVWASGLEDEDVLEIVVQPHP